MKMSGRNDFQQYLSVVRESTSVPQRLGKYVGCCTQRLKKKIVQILGREKACNT